MTMSDLKKRVISCVEQVKLVDTHEHLISESQRAEQCRDIFYWFCQYASSDLISAGMTGSSFRRIRDFSLPLDERWALFEPYWQYTRTTSYGRALLIAARDIFGIEDINADACQELSMRIADSNRPGWYEYVLRERAGIEVVLQDCIAPLDPASEPEGPALCDDRHLVAPVHWLGIFQRFRTRQHLEALERLLDARLSTLDDLLGAIHTDLEQSKARGYVALKMRVAYMRSLRFDRVPKADAERSWNKIFAHYGEGLSNEELKPLQDYIAHYLVQKSIELDLPLQIHTGFQEGNVSILTDSNPTLLTNLFIEYPRARFVIFHGGYPYCGEAAALAKNFANVYLDTCWLPMLSQAAAARWLDEWLETVPSNKLFGFGGDCRFVEGSYANSRIARRIVADVISRKIESGYLTEDEGLAVVPRLLRENAWDFYRLEERWAQRERKDQGEARHVSTLSGCPSQSRDIRLTNGEPNVIY